MGLAQPKQSYTPQEYLRLERGATEKHAYFRGEIFAMAGGSVRHSLITARAIRHLGNRLAGRGCEVFESNLRVRIPRTTLYTYPDLSVVCGPVAFDPLDQDQETILNPTLIVEVLSPSTEAYDRGAKFENYQTIESLRGYLLLSQNAPRAELFTRQPDDTWLYAASAGLDDGRVRLDFLNAELPLSEVYDGVSFAAPAVDAPGAE